MVTFESLAAVSYSHSIVTMTVSLAVLTQYTNVTASQRPRLFIASRGNHTRTSLSDCINSFDVCDDLTRSFQSHLKYGILCKLLFQSKPLKAVVQTDEQTDEQSATHNAASYKKGCIIITVGFIVAAYKGFISMLLLKCVIE